jgi:putative transposase
VSPTTVERPCADEQSSFVSEFTAYRLLKAQNLTTSPACIFLRAVARFQHPTTHANEMWQTDFAYCKLVGWGSRHGLQ